MDRFVRMGLATILVTVLQWAGWAWAEEGEPTARTGMGLYLRHCAPCHGDDARGGGPNAALFANTPRDLREGFLRRYPTDDLVARVLEGRPLRLALDIGALKRHSSQVGAIERHMRRLPELDWLQIEHGWSIYAERCTLCHGPFGKPQGEPPKGVRPPRDLGSADFQKSVDDAALLQAVRHGRAGMPALVPRLRTDEAEKVIAFVRLLGPGFEGYSKFCGQCHGDDGVGIGNFDSTVEAPAVTFDRDYFARVDQAHLRESIWHMLYQEKPTMPHFRGALGEPEVRLIVDYLRALPEK